MAPYADRLYLQAQDSEKHRPFADETDPITDLPSVNDPAAYWKLIRILSASQRGRAKHLFLAAYAPTETIAARNREYAQVCLDTIREAKLRLQIIRDRTVDEVRELEEYCATPLVDLQTVAEILPKLGTLKYRIKIINARLS